MTTSAKIRLAIVSQVLSVLTHLYLVSSYYRLKFGMADGKSLCNISDLLNCDAVSASPYSSVFGIPLALGGVFFNAFLLIALVWFSQFPQRYLKDQIKVFATLLVGISLAMAAVSFSMLSTYCLFCIFTYAFSLLTLACVWSLHATGDSTDTFFSGAGLRWFLVGLLALPAFSTLSHAVIKANLAKDFDQQLKIVIDGWLSGTDANVANIQGMRLGADPTAAKMLIVEFADFQCIHCKMAAPSVKNFVKSRRDVALVYVPFPLDGQCNSAISKAGDGRSCVLSASAICADQQGQGWKVHEWIFENFGKFELSELTSFVESTGLDMEKFRLCREAPATMDTIRANAKLGELAGVKGTPTFFVNGRQLQGAQFLPILDAAHQKILGK